MNKKVKLAIREFWVFMGILSLALIFGGLMLGTTGVTVLGMCYGVGLLCLISFWWIIESEVEKGKAANATVLDPPKGSNTTPPSGHQQRMS